MRIHFGSFLISGYGQIYSCFILWEFCWKYSCDQFICIEFHFFLLYLRMIFHNFRTPKAFDDDFDIFWISWYVFVLYPFEALTGNFRILWICCHSVAHTQIDLFSPRGVFMSIFMQSAPSEPSQMFPIDSNHIISNRQIEWSRNTSKWNEMSILFLLSEIWYEFRNMCALDSSHLWWRGCMLWVCVVSCQ